MSKKKKDRQEEIRFVDAKQEIEYQIKDRNLYKHNNAKFGILPFFFVYILDEYVFEYFNTDISLGDYLINYDENSKRVYRLYGGVKIRK